MTFRRWLAGVVSALAGRLRMLADRLYPPYPERLRREGYDSGGIHRAGAVADPPPPTRKRPAGGSGQAKAKYDSGGILRAGVVADLDFATAIPERDLSPAEIVTYEAMLKRLIGE